MSALDKVKSWFQGAKDQGQSMAAKGQDMASNAADRAQDMAGQAKDMASNAVDEVKEHIPGGGDDATSSQS